MVRIELNLYTLHIRYIGYIHTAWHWSQIVMYTISILAIIYALLSSMTHNYKIYSSWIKKVNFRNVFNVIMPNFKPHCHDGIPLLYIVKVWIQYLWPCLGRRVITWINFNFNWKVKSWDTYDILIYSHVLHLSWATHVLLWV
jgi:hypothetical protein